MATMAKDDSLMDGNAAGVILPSGFSKQPEPSAPPRFDGGPNGTPGSFLVQPVERHHPEPTSDDALFTDEEEQAIALDEDAVPLPLPMRLPKTATVVEALPPAPEPAVAVAVAEAVPSLPHSLPPMPLSQAMEVCTHGMDINRELDDWKRRQRKMYAGLGLIIVALIGTVIGLAVDRTNAGEDGGGEPPAMTVLPGKPTSRILVDHLYTYGAPSVTNPHMSNPGNKCIPGIRTYTEDISSGDDCKGGEAGCDQEEHYTNTDFVAGFNNNLYPHPKMSTLTLRWRDDAHVEYIHEKCDDADDIDQYQHQWWPGSQTTRMEAGQNIHNLREHYEPRLAEVPMDTRGPLLEYASVSACHKNSAKEVKKCIDTYESGGLRGVGSLGYEMLAFMNHKTKLGEGIADNDTVFVLKNDINYAHRKCIISFKGSETYTGDLGNFLFGKAGAGDYCGSRGVHTGVKDELWQLTNNPQYERHIKPALASCQELSCVGHSLGGALCNVFTMCANQGLENLNQKGDRGDFCSLVWNGPELCS